MADIALGIINRLNTDSGVSGLIGSRCYPDYDRQSDRVYPLAVYHFEITPLAAFDGPTGLQYAIGRIAAVATTYAQVTQIADAIYNALEQRSGVWGGVTVQGCFLQQDGITDDVVTEQTSEEILYYVKQLTFDISYST